MKICLDNQGIAMDCSKHLLANLNDCNFEFFNFFVKKVSFDFLYTLVEISDGSQGMAINYDYPNSSKLDFFNVNCEKILVENRFDLAGLSVKVAIISALSQRFFNKEHLSKLNCKIQTEKFRVSSVIKKEDVVSVVGWGGLMDAVGRSDSKKMNLVELQYNNSTKMFFDVACGDLNRKYNKPVQCFGCDEMDVLEKSDVVCITASALCNNTIDGVLSYCKGAREIIIQGPSGSVYPVSFFDKGVTGVLTYFMGVDLFELFYINKDARREPNKYLQEVYMGANKNLNLY